LGERVEGRALVAVYFKARSEHVFEPAPSPIRSGSAYKFNANVDCLSEFAWPQSAALEACPQPVLARLPAATSIFVMNFIHLMSIQGSLVLHNE